jgi:hypothetical protein
VVVGPNESVSVGVDVVLKGPVSVAVVVLGSRVGSIGVEVVLRKGGSVVSGGSTIVVGSGMVKLDVKDEVSVGTASEPVVLRNGGVALAEPELVVSFDGKLVGSGIEAVVLREGVSVVVGRELVMLRKGGVGVPELMVSVNEGSRSVDDVQVVVVGNSVSGGIMRSVDVLLGSMSDKVVLDVSVVRGSVPEGVAVPVPVPVPVPSEEPSLEVNVRTVVEVVDSKDIVIVVSDVKPGSDVVGSPIIDESDDVDIVPVTEGQDDPTREVIVVLNVLVIN